MLINRIKHERVMGRILEKIYSDVSIAPLLGFKGGTAALFFYELPRFSIDLDFDLFPPDKKNQDLVFEKIKKIIAGEKDLVLKEVLIKKNTIFALVSYGEKDRNIKVEISARDQVLFIDEGYGVREYFGLSVLVAKKESMFANKLLALGIRRRFAMRDVFDVHYFSKNNWGVDERIISAKTGGALAAYLPVCIARVEQVPENETLSGLGELIDEKTKEWVKKNLKRETIFLLKNHLAALSR